MNDVIKDLSELRLSYEQGELHESQMSVNPHEQFLNWFNHALTAQLHEPYAMSLATANAQGRPHVRTVLSYVGPGGLSDSVRNDGRSGTHVTKIK